MQMCSHCQGQSVTYGKQDLRQALRDGQGLREDWRALRKKERILERRVAGKTPRVSMVLRREHAWDGDDGARKSRPVASWEGAGSETPVLP